MHEQYILICVLFNCQNHLKETSLSSVLRKKKPSEKKKDSKCTPRGIIYRWQKRLRSGKFWHWLHEGRKLGKFYSGKMLYARGMEIFRVPSSKSFQWTGGRDLWKY